MHGSERIRGYWHTAEGDRCRKRDECLMKQVSLLQLLKQKILS
jgi:hypothetical protein